MDDLNLLKYNRHWEKGFIYPYVKKRQVFEKLLETLPKRQIVEVTGLRRTGKTVLLLQLINRLVEKKVNPFSLWYFTFDETVSDLDSLFQKFSVQTQLDFKKEKIYVFLDEIQKLDNFQSQLKIYYDLYPNLKFFISGSTSLFVRKKTQESLAGRIISLFLHPLNFGEYLDFKEREDILEKPSAFGPEIEREFEIFLRSQLIESIKMENPDEKKDYILSIIKKIIYEDIPQIFPIENPEILWSLVRTIANGPGLSISLRGLSSDLGISQKTLAKYLFYLEESFLIKKVYNFSKNLLTSEKKLKKYYLASPSFSLAISDFAEKGKLAENFVISVRDYRFFWRDNYGHEVDFIEVANEKIIPIEVKYRQSVSAREIKNLLLFSKKFKAREAVLLGKFTTEETEKIAGLKIKKIPLFFLS